MPSIRPTSLSPVFTDKATGRLYHQDGTPVGSAQDAAGTMPADLSPVFKSSGGLVDAEGNSVGGGSTTPAAVVSAQLASMQGTLGALYVLSDGTDAGAKLTWAVPRGESQPTWCWWLWPQQKYEEK